MTVKVRDLKGQARAFSTLAGLYEESRQLVKAHELYWNVRIEIKYYCKMYTLCTIDLFTVMFGHNIMLSSRI